MTGPAESLARELHRAYSELVPFLGYEVTPLSSAPWDELPERQRAALIGLSGKLLDDRVISLNGES